jgi:hypothetical protein
MKKPFDRPATHGMGVAQLELTLSSGPLHANNFLTPALLQATGSFFDLSRLMAKSLQECWWYPSRAIWCRFDR